MKQIGEGILHGSEIYFSSPSVKAKSFYYHVLCAGHFYCDKNYSLTRQKYDSILILHVIDGSFTFKSSTGEYVTAKENETVVIDCYAPHEYYTSDKLESVWIHASGVNIKELYNEIVKTTGDVIKTKNSEIIKRRMLRVFCGIGAENALTEAEISVEVYKIFMELMNPSGVKNEHQRKGEDNIQKAKDYISSHIGEDIKVCVLADLVHMSSTHFSRVFKSVTGFSPYDYVLAARINKAKELLLVSDMSVMDIAYEVGFNSEANFIYCFTKSEGISPGKFRKIQF